MNSDSTVSPASLCPHFGDCGGCQSQDVPYEAQLAAKQAALEELYLPYWQAPITVTPSPVLWNYRNKVDPAFAPKQYDTAPPPGFTRETVLGFKRKGRWFWPLEIEACHIGPPGLGELLQAVRQWAAASGHVAYDSRTGAGMLRNLLVRTAPRTGERMVVLITRSGPMNLDGFVDAVQAAFPSHSIQRGTTDRKADVAVADELELLHGAPHITARMDIPAYRSLDFRVSPMSFFQTNTLATERLYGRIREWVAEDVPDLLLDLYGGSGGIAFTCADLAPEIWSVEEVAPATEDGRYNATLNGIENVAFHTADVRAWSKRQAALGGLPPRTLAIVDPPRAGLHPKVLRRLGEMGPERIIYVSCNPKILAQECAALTSNYRLSRLEAFDLFPHTRHVELLALFERTGNAILT
jgi:23S rRNA (uracil1939-C5)-methyltransferase